MAQDKATATRGSRRRGRRPPADEPGEIRLTAQMVHRAVQALKQRARVDRRWDIPYLAGYSRAGRTIFIDRDLPRTFEHRGRRVRIEPFMIIHEAVEISLLDKLGLDYQDAHLVALMAERSAVQACGVAWTGYQRFMLRHIKRAGSKQLKLVPRNLHLTPYLDERDLALLSEMLPLMQEEWER